MLLYEHYFIALAASVRLVLPDECANVRTTMENVCLLWAKFFCGSVWFLDNVGAIAPDKWQSYNNAFLRIVYYKTQIPRLGVLILLLIIGAPNQSTKLMKLLVPP